MANQVCTPYPSSRRIGLMAGKLGASGLAERIRECAGIVGSGDALAEQSGIPRRTLENYLSGKSEPKASALLAIAKSAGRSLDWLIAGDDPLDRSGAIAPSTTPPSAAPAKVTPATGQTLDGELLGLCFEGVKRTYKESSARIDDRSAGKLAARIYADVIAATADDPDPEAAQRGALRVALRQFHRELQAPPKAGSSKHSA